MTLGSFTSDEVVAYMLHAGSASQRLRFVRNDRSTLERLEGRLRAAQLDPRLLDQALSKAADFSTSSIQRVVARRGGDDALSL